MCKFLNRDVEVQSKDWRPDWTGGRNIWHARTGPDRTENSKIKIKKIIISFMCKFINSDVEVQSKDRRPD